MAFMKFINLHFSDFRELGHCHDSQIQLGYIVKAVVMSFQSNIFYLIVYNVGYLLIGIKEFL